MLSELHKTLDLNNMKTSLEGYKQIKQTYETPEIDVFLIPQAINILEIVSLEGDIEDFQDGDDF